ncbi:MAG TPA: hypothetical protein PK957_01545 [Candidatus Dojkabacteria bacterium]|nr:hypothetical protein [Candidatus Dojkabacteria bacterium]HQF36359.1 hypothetical protein [Candidatus Dojkabacteria bacterium]
MKSKKILITSIVLIGISILSCVLSLGYIYFKNRDSKKYNPFYTIKEESYNIKNQTIERELIVQKISQDNDSFDEVLSENKVTEKIKESKENKEISANFSYSDSNMDQPKECELYIHDSDKYSKCSDDEWYSDDFSSIDDLIEEQNVINIFVKYENYFTLRKNLNNILVQIYNKDQWVETKEENQTTFESTQTDTVQKILDISSIDKFLSSTKQEIDRDSIKTSVKIVAKNNQINEIEFQISFLFEEKDHNFNKQNNKLTITSKTKFLNINSTETQINIDEITAKIDPVIKLTKSAKAHQEIENLTINATSNFVNHYTSSSYKSEDHFSITETHKINTKDELALIDYNAQITYDKGNYYQSKENKIGTVYRYQDNCMTKSDDIESCYEIYYYSIDSLWTGWTYFEDVLLMINEPSTVPKDSIKYIGNELINGENYFLYEIDANKFEYLTLKRTNVYDSTQEGTVKIWLKESTNQIYKIHITFTEEYTENGESGESMYNFDVKTTYDTTFKLADINNTEFTFPEDIKEEIQKDTDYY